MNGGMWPVKHMLILTAMCCTLFVHAQGSLVITNVTVTEEGVETKVNDVTALITASPAKGRVILYEKDGVQIGAWVRTSTPNMTKGATTKSSASIIIVLDLVTNLHREKREVGRTFLPDEERVMRIIEKFTVQIGGGKRKLTVAFDGRIE
jgi:hypothetical protein